MRKNRFILLGVLVALVLAFVAYRSTKRHVALETETQEQPLGPLPDAANTRIYVELRDMVFRLGPIDRTRVQLEKWTCIKLPSKGHRNCSFSEDSPEGLFQVSLVLNGNFVKSFTVVTMNPHEIAEIDKQLRERLPNSEALFAKKAELLPRRQYGLGDEELTLISSPNLPATKPMLTMTVEFKDPNKPQ